MPPSTKYYSLFYSVLAVSTVYALGYAWFFLEQYRLALFSVLGVMLGAGMIVWWVNLKGKTGASKGYATVGLMLLYSAAWLGLVIVLLLLEFGVAWQAMKDLPQYRQSKDWRSFVVKVSPFLLLFINLLSWQLWSPHRSKKGT